MKTIGLATYSDAPLLIAEDQPLIPLLAQYDIHAIPFDWESPLPDGLDGILLRSCWNSHLKPLKFLSWIDSLPIPLWNPKAVVRWNQDKSHLIELQGKGVLIPRTVILSPGSCEKRTSQILSSDFSEFVIKPVVSASAYGTYRLSAAHHSDIRAAVQSIPESSSILLQEFVPTIQTEGEISYVFFGGEYSHAVRKRPKAGDFRVQEDHGGSFQEYHGKRSLIEEAAKILAAAEGLSWLYARVDVVPFRDKLYLMEIEAIDPMLYFAWAPGARVRFAKAVADRI